MRRATALLGLCLVLGSGPASAGDACGDPYRVKPGDRPAAIADTCGVPLARPCELTVIARPSDLSPGSMLRLRPGAPVADVPEGRPGDTVRSVAKLHDVPVPALPAANGPDQMPDLVPAMDILIPGGDGAAPGAAPGDDGGTVLTGTISQGVECPILTTAEGKVWSLAGEIPGTVMGREARVTGTMARMSFCMQGEGTLNVDEVVPVAE